MADARIDAWNVHPAVKRWETQETILKYKAMKEQINPQVAGARPGASQHAFILTSMLSKHLQQRNNL